MEFIDNDIDVEQIRCYFTNRPTKDFVDKLKIYLPNIPDLI